MSQRIKNVVAFSGGVGGAKLAYGLYHTLPAESLTIIINTGDDFEHLGLHIAPDIDTVMYTLADLANPKTGWGIRDETWAMMDALAQYGGPTWFNLGDHDLATHLLRTTRLRAGESYQQVTQDLATRLGVRCALVPMSEQPIRTMVRTTEGVLPFQVYFVKRRAEPQVTGLHFAGVDSARPNPQAVAAINQADVLIFCPSNPLLSLDPILAVPTLRDLIAKRDVPKIGVSPIVGGQAIKGPTAKMMTELGMDVSVVGVARYLRDVLTAWVIDRVDASHEAALGALGLEVFISETVMRTNEDRIRLAEKIIQNWSNYDTQT